MLEAIRLPLALLLCLIVAESSFAQRSVFDKDIMEKWKAYELFSRSLQGTAQGTGTSPSGKPRHFIWRYKQNRDCAFLSKWELESPDSNVETILLANSRYTARIKRSKTNSNDVKLVDYAENKNAPLFGGSTSVVNRVFLETSLHFCCCLMPLTALVTDPNFSVTRTTKEIQDGHEFVRVDYHYFHKDPRSPRKMTRNGSIYFDSSHCWCIRQIKENVESLLHEKVESKYMFDDRYETIQHSSGFPLLKLRIHNMNRQIVRNKDSKEETAHTITEYEWEVNDREADAKFTLTAFGLPEPMGVPPPSRSYAWIWLITAAVLASVLAAVFSWLKRRQALKTHARTVLPSDTSLS